MSGVRARGIYIGIVFFCIVFMSWPVYCFSQNGSVLIIFYRPKAFKGGLIQYDLKNGGAVIGRIKNGVIFNYNCTAGLLKIEAATETHEAIFIDAKPGEKYYVRCTVTTGWLSGRPALRQVSEEQASKEIEEIKQSSKP